MKFRADRKGRGLVAPGTLLLLRKQVLVAQCVEHGDPERVTQVLERGIRRRNALGVRPSGAQLATRQTGRARAEVEVDALLRVDHALLSPARLALPTLCKAVTLLRTGRPHTALANLTIVRRFTPQMN